MSFIATTEGVPDIDLYDTPIDLRPLPRKGSVQWCIEYLRSRNDHYGANLLEDEQ